MAFDWAKDCDPTIMIGEKVWYITRDGNPSYGNKDSLPYRSAVVSGYIAAVRDGKAYCTGLKTNLAGDEDEIDVRFCYKNEEDVKADSRWISCKNVSDDEWVRAIGNRHLIAEQVANKIGKDVFRNEQTKKRYFALIDKENVEECELPACCGNISDARDMLIYCREQKGLIFRDVICLKDLLVAHDGDFFNTVDSRPVLKKILRKLGIQKWFELRRQRAPIAVEEITRLRC